MEFSLNEIFLKAFGYESPTKEFTIPAAPVRLETSSLGQPYYMEDLFGREFFLPVTINGYLIPFAVIGMTWKKTYVSTPMPDRGGSVKELINIDDYQFNIKGIILNDANSFPEKQLMELYELFQINASLEMRCALTDIMLNGEYNHSVVIKDIKWPTVTGIEHAKPFEIEVESDMIFTLELD